MVGAGWGEGRRGGPMSSPRESTRARGLDETRINNDDTKKGLSIVRGCGQPTRGDVIGPRAIGDQQHIEFE